MGAITCPAPRQDGHSVVGNRRAQLHCALSTAFDSSDCNNASAEASTQPVAHLSPSGRLPSASGPLSTSSNCPHQSVHSNHSQFTGPDRTGPAAGCIAWARERRHPLRHSARLDWAALHYNADVHARRFRTNATQRACARATCSVRRFCTCAHTCTVLYFESVHCMNTAGIGGGTRRTRQPTRHRHLRASFSFPSHLVSSHLLFSTRLRMRMRYECERRDAARHERGSQSPSLMLLLMLLLPPLTSASAAAAAPQHVHRIASRRIWLSARRRLCTLSAEFTLAISDRLATSSMCVRYFECYFGAVLEAILECCVFCPLLPTSAL